MIERADKKKNLDKVAASLIKNPLQSQREVEKDTWISRTTVWKVIKELDKTWQWGKDNRIVSLTDKDFELMLLIQKRKFERMKDKEDRVNDSDLNNWDKEAKARYSLFRWEVTDSEWGLKDQSALDSLNSLLDS